MRAPLRRAVPRWFPLSLSLSLTVAGATSRAEVLWRQVIAGRAVSVERGAGGALTLVGASPTPLALAQEGAAGMERVELQGGAAALVVRVEGPSQPLVVVYGSSARPPSVAWQGDGAWRGEDVAERGRDEVLLADVNGDGARDVVVARRQRARSLCSLGAPLREARALDPLTGSLSPVALDPLSQGALLDGARAPDARRLVATEGALRPPALPGPRFVTSEGEGSAALGDARADTAWPTPTGSFATARVEYGALGLRAIDLTAPTAGRALPRRWTVLVEAMDGQNMSRLEVDVPEALATRPGAVARVALDPEVRVRCVALIAGEAPTRGAPALAGIALRTALDEAGADPVAALVSVARERGGASSVRLLLAMGDRGVAALSEALPSLPTAAAREAVRLLGSDPRPGVDPALVAALSREDVAAEAEAALLRRGASALEPLSRAVEATPSASGVVARLRVPALARARALSGALEADGAPWHAARRALAGLLSAAAREGDAEALLALVPEGPRGASRMLRLLSEALPREAPGRAALSARARALWSSVTEFEHRWRVLPALAGDEAGRALLAEAARADDADLRAEAVRVLGGSPEGDEALRAALGDRSPRVRAAAARALSGRAGALQALVGALERDPWPTVRVAAIEALSGERGAVEALLDALEQASVPVVRASLVALARTPGEGVVPRLVAFVDDGRRNPELRREAVEALGARCDRRATADLERLAASLTNPALPPYEQALGHAAMAALARLDPARARALMGRSQTNAAAVAAVERAIADGCRP